MARETWAQSQVKLYQRLKKCFLDVSLLNIQLYKVRIKGKGEQSRERSTHWLPLYSVPKGEKGVPIDYHYSQFRNLGVVAIEKGAFGLVTNFIYLYIYIYISGCA